MRNPHKLIAVLAFALSGCSSLGGGVADFVPYVQDITHVDALKQDESDCREYALAYPQPLSGVKIGTAAVRGAAGNVAGAAVNPLVPALGAAGSASVELLDEIGLLNDKEQRVFLICLHDRGERSGAYHVMDPNL